MFKLSSIHTKKEKFGIINKIVKQNFEPELCNRFENRDERDGGSFDVKTADNGDSIDKDFAEKNVPYLLTNSESYRKIRVEVRAKGDQAQIAVPILLMGQIA
jgi:hypothetical protein